MRWILALLTTVAALPGCGQTQSKPVSQDHFPITTQMVVQALSLRGVQAEDQQVFLLARVVSNQPQPVLDILTVEPQSNVSFEKHTQVRTIVKLASHSSATCLPFYAIVNWPSVPDGIAPASPALTPAAEYTNSNSKSAITMRAGTHATLVMDDERSHIQIAVITLEGGITGREIRVASTDHKQFYLGKVVSANLLRRSY